MRISDWSSDVCSSYLRAGIDARAGAQLVQAGFEHAAMRDQLGVFFLPDRGGVAHPGIGNHPEGSGALQFQRRKRRVADPFVADSTARAVDVQTSLPDHRTIDHRAVRNGPTGLPLVSLTYGPPPP